MKITKASGELVPFSVEKLKRSLSRSRANPEIIAHVVRQVENQLYEGMSSKAIYQLAFRLLKQDSKPTAARYKLKQAIMELGPTGYPFETYVAKVLEAEGYQTKTGEIVQGRCVTHEIDILATKGQDVNFIECKFHNVPGIFCDVKIPLYIQSRYIDVSVHWQKDPKNQGLISRGWVVTNTRFSSDAERYGTCMGLYLMSWDYPENGSLKERIDATGVHPITCLTTLNKSEKHRLLEKKTVLCKELVLEPARLSSLGMRNEKQTMVLNECRSLSNTE